MPSLGLPKYLVDAIRDGGDEEFFNVGFLQGELWQDASENSLKFAQATSDI